MKTKKLKNLIKKVQNALDWPIIEQPEDVPVVRILSDPHFRTHIIHMPINQNAHVDDYNYLHELGHASLCERVHPVFAANSYFAASTSQEHFVLLAPALQTACDWYISYWFQDICPEKFKECMTEKLETVKKILVLPRLPTVDVLLDAAQTVALGIKYFDAPIDCGDKLKQAVDSFLAVRPDKPTRDDFEQMVNNLMAIYTPVRARIAQDNEYDIWETSLTDDAPIDA